MDPIGQCEPLLEAKLELREPDLYYMPSLEPEDPDGLDQLILSLLNDITNMAALVPRLKTDSIGYAEELASDVDMKGMKDEILANVTTAVEEATDFCSNFEGIIITIPNEPSPIRFSTIICQKSCITQYIIIVEEL